MMPTPQTTMVWSLLALGAVCAVLGAWPVIRLRPKQYCPGPRRRLRELWLPWRWFLAHGCGYDLRGTAPQGHSLRCSECGTLHTRLRNLRRSPRALRPMRLAAILLIAGLITHALFPPRLGKMMRQAPTSALILAETYFHSSLPIDVLVEMRNRYWRGEMSDSDIRKLVPLLVDALRDDDKELNGDVARKLLFSLVKERNEQAVAELHAALDSPDWQQRQMAADILRHAWDGTPSEAMLRVSFEALRHDIMPVGVDARGKHSRTLIRNAFGSASYLAQHFNAAHDWIAHGLDADDWQQQQFCAIIVLRVQTTDLLPQAMAILIDCLRDNDTQRDAWRSQEALIAFGPDAIPWLEPYCQAEDAQQRVRALRIIDQIRQTAKEIEPPDAIRGDL